MPGPLTVPGDPAEESEMTRPEPTVLLPETQFNADEPYYSITVTSEAVTVETHCCLDTMSDETIVKLFGALAHHPAVIRHQSLVVADAMAKMQAMGAPLTITREEARRLFGMDSDGDAVDVTITSDAEPRVVLNVDRLASRFDSDGP